MIEIIPATDIIDGACVRLTQGDYASRKTYYRDPLEAALRFEEAGIRRLHMVDLDGAKASEPRNLAVLERIAARTSLEVQYGGGHQEPPGAFRRLRRRSPPGHLRQPRSPPARSFRRMAHGIRSRAADPRRRHPRRRGGHPGLAGKLGPSQRRS